MWRSQTFENIYQGGYLVVLPYELLPHWVGEGPIYDDLCNYSPGPVDYVPVGTGFGVFVAGPEGDIIHEAWWRRDSPEGPVMVVAWNEWDPEERDRWLEAQLAGRDLDWERHPQELTVDSGVLVLLHAEGKASEARLARADAGAECGECLPVGVTPGRYAVETVEIEERPEGSHCVELCRFIRVS